MTENNTDKVLIDEEENLVSVDSKSPRIRTLEQLINACEIDLDVWEIERHVINKWEVGAKLPDDLGGGLVVSPLFQVKAWLIRRVPAAVHPVLQPVQVQIDPPDVLPASRYGVWRKVLYFTDPHFGFSRDLQTGRLTPFHDRRALDVILQLCQRNQFDTVVIGGDMLDLADWTDKFLRMPEFTMATQPAVIEAAWWLGKLRRLMPDTKIYIIEGNHDLRMRDSLVTHLLAAYKLRPAHDLHVETALSVPILLGLEGLNIEWVGGYPESRVWLSDYLSCEHGDVARKGPGATGRALLGNGSRSILYGHIHRQEAVSELRDDRDGPWSQWAICPGCTCRIDGVVPGHKRRQGWQQGAVIVDYDGKGHQQFEVVSVWDGRSFYKGRSIKARDVRGELGKLGEETGWGFL